MQPGVVPGAVLELHAAKALSGLSPQVNSPLGVAWQDTSGNGNHGTLVGFTGETPWVGAGTPSDPYRLVFDGANDYINLGNLPVFDFSDAFTIEMVTAFSAANTTIVGVFGKYQSSAGYDIALSSGQLRMAARGTTTLDSTTHGPTGLNDGVRRHHHIVVTKTSIIFFVNGVQAGTATVGTWVPVAATAPLTWGRRYSDNYVNQAAPLLRVYPFGLTAAQVAQNYNAGPLWAPVVSGFPVIGSPIVKGIGGTP